MLSYTLMYIAYPNNGLPNPAHERQGDLKLHKVGPEWYRALENI